MSLILDLKTLERVCSNIASQKKEIVLTHGAFDLLHIGHIEMLRKSKALGKYLIVGVDSDERIRKYKNVKRPFIPDKYRMEMLTSLKFVDVVFCLEGNSISDSYYWNIYSKIVPSTITYGRNFSFSKEIKQRISKSKFSNFTKVQQISHQYDNIFSTTEIINEIRNVNPS